MKNSRPILEKISDQCFSHTRIFKFNEDIDVSQKYRKGRITASQWLNELTYYYIQKESNFLEEFKEHIQSQKKELSNIKEGDYKQGLFDQLNSIEELICKND